MNNDNQKDAQVSTIPEDDAAEQTAESSKEQRELTDSEIASVAAGFMVVGEPPRSTPPSPRPTPQ